MIKYLLLLLSIPFFLSSEIIWQAEMQTPFSLTIKLSSKQISQDALLHFEANFRYPSTYHLKSDALLDQLTWSANPLFPQIILEETSLAKGQAEEGMQSQTLYATLRPLSTGFVVLSPMNVIFTSLEKEHSSLHVSTPIFSIEVSPISIERSLSFASLVPLNPEFPLDVTQANRKFLMEGPERLEKEKTHIKRVLSQHTFPWLTFMIFLGLGGIGWSVYLNRDRWPKRMAKPITPLSAKQKADQAFSKLHEQQLLEKKDFKSYYTELSTMLVQALQEHFNWKSKELTTAEISAKLTNSSALSQNQKLEIFSILLDLDQVKFAGKQPSLEAATQMEQRVKKCIYQGID